MTTFCGCRASGFSPKPVKPGAHIYKVGRIPRNLWPTGERLEPRFGKLGREYGQIVFDKELLKQDATLEWVTPGHPLFEAVREYVRQQAHAHLKRGTVFFNLHSEKPYRLTGCNITSSSPAPRVSRASMP